MERIDTKTEWTKFTMPTADFKRAFGIPQDASVISVGVSFIDDEVEITCDKLDDSVYPIRETSPEDIPAELSVWNKFWSGGR